MVLTPIMANYQFKTNFTIKSGYLISQLIDCMDKTTKQQIPITHAHKHIEVFTERRKTHNRQKTLRGPIAPNQSTNKDSCDTLHLQKLKF